MLTEPIVEKLALFYYFAFLDEAKAYAATVKTIKKIRQNRVTDSALKSAAETDDLSRLVSITHKFMTSHKKEFKPTAVKFSTGYVRIPHGSNWGPWFEYRKTSDVREFHTLVYAKILNIPETAISQGMAIPLGTVRFRVNHGLKVLGKIIQTGGQNG